MVSSPWAILLSALNKAEINELLLCQISLLKITHVPFVRDFVCTYTMLICVHILCMHIYTNVYVSMCV